MQADQHPQEVGLVDDIERLHFILKSKIKVDFEKLES
jgi:hypothetical protein